MKTIHKTWTDLLKDCVLIMFVAGTIGIALKFTVFFDKWVYFPSFPNICDSLFLISSTVYLALKAKATTTKHNKETAGELIS